MTMIPASLKALICTPAIGREQLSICVVCPGAAGCDDNGKLKIHTVIACSLDHLDAFLDNNLDVFGVRWRNNGRQERQVNTKRLVSHGSASSNLLSQILRCGLRQSGQNSKTTSIRNSRSHFCCTNPLHTTCK